MRRRIWLLDLGLGVALAAGGGGGEGASASSSPPIELEEEEASGVTGRRQCVRSPFPWLLPNTVRTVIVGKIKKKKPTRFC